MIRIITSFSALLFLGLLTGCVQKIDLKPGDAKAIIGTQTIYFKNAQSGINRIGGGLYSTLSIVFGTSNGDGVSITLVAKDGFTEKEYRVRQVETPAEENAQLTYYRATEKAVYEAVGNNGQGSVTITEMTKTSIKGFFSGKFVLQNSPSSALTIKDGEFNASFGPPVDGF